MAAAKKAAPKKKDNMDEKQNSGKNFRADLQSFLQDAFEESFEKHIEQKKQELRAIKTKAATKSGKPARAVRKQSRPTRPRRGGLDALIRATVTPSKMEMAKTPTRRLTLTFDENKLDKLKTIAREERTMLKDIIDEIVVEYIQHYEKEKGES